jgi:hypothetical protein
MKGRRWITLVSAMLCSAAVIAVAAGPASARVPDGQGLGIFGVFDCGDFDAEAYGAPAVEAANFYLLDPETGTGPHVVATRYEETVDGEVVFEKDFGNKAGLTRFNCAQLVAPGDVFTLTVAVVPRG